MSLPFHYFKYSKAQQSGLFILLFVITVLLLANQYFPFSSKNEIFVDHELMNQFQKEVDSLSKLKKQKKYQLKPFNPNYLSDYKGYQLGLSIEEIDRLLTYRSQGKFVNSAIDFQKITKVSDSLLTTIAPYFKFPDWVKKQVSKEKKIHKAIVKKDLNTATALDFRSINGIGEAYSNRIVKYRNFLQGFSTHDQLKEVYGLDESLQKKILTRFKIKEKPIIKKQNINTATFKEVLALPYTNYEMTKMIFNYKNQVAKIKSIDELIGIKDFPSGKIDRLLLYLHTE
jgi:DNA uptake protein ComE-like DNA-binding protein